MRTITSYIRQYFRSIDKFELIVVSVFTAMLVFINYYFDLDGMIRKNKSFIIKLLWWYIVFQVAFLIPYLVNNIRHRSAFIHVPAFWFLIVFAPFLFALKISLGFYFYIDRDPVQNNFWNHVLYWPLLFVIVASCLLIAWKILYPRRPFCGITKKNISLKPYFQLVLIMIPLIALASTQADFLAVYPKIKTVAGMTELYEMSWWQKLIFELSYGTDFLTIELFFRGFLILAFIKWAGKDAILPMACFYCAIHFGKPVGECISSYFGGILLGIIVYNTRSIYGGLVVHLGIAWLMELGGYVGNTYF